MSDVILMEKVKKSFGRNLVLEQMDLAIPKGVVYGLIGLNGVGKTTTIRLLLGLVNSDAGMIHVLGLDPRKSGWKIRQQVGYVAENQKMYPWMTTKESLWFVSQFYPTWDDEYAKQLCERFSIDSSKKVKDLSRGMLSKLFLIMAMSHRPKILVLDEATSGLDATIRRDFLKGVIEFVQQEGMTVLISSHLLTDLERVVDHIGYIKGGNIQISGNLEGLKDSFRKVKLLFEENYDGKIEIPGLLQEERSGRQVMLTLKNFSEKTQKSLENLPSTSMEFVDMSLEDLFTECLSQC